MNKVTLELLRKATTTHYHGLGEIDELDQKKFVELLVRECAEVAACNAHVSGFALGDLIKQHFGVEE